MIDKKVVKRFGELAAAIACAAVPMLGEADEPTGRVVMTYERHDVRDFQVSVHADKSVIYRGMGNVKVIGERRFHISDAQYNTVLKAFQQAGFEKMETLYESPFGDPVATLPRKYALVVSLDVQGTSKVVRSDSFSFLGWPRTLYTLLWTIEDTLELARFLCPARIVQPNVADIEVCQSTREREKTAFERSK
jgi:hypothetical protein